MQSYWEKVSRDTIIIQGEGFKGCNHTGRRFQGIQSLYREKVSRDTIIIQGGFKGYNHTGRRFKGIQLYWERD